jgi:thiamine biosynthesis lipoprotein
MPLVETLPVGPGTAQWSLWSTTARLVVTDPGSLPRARELVAELTARVEAACSRFRPDSELSRLPADGRPVKVGALLAELVAAALLAARRTDGDVDPTLGDALAAAGYDRTFVLVGDGPVRGVCRTRDDGSRCVWTGNC